MAQSIILRRWETIATVRATVRDCPDLQRHPFRIWLGDRPPGAELLNRPTMWSCRRTGKVVWETRRPFSFAVFVAASRRFVRSGRLPRYCAAKEIVDRS